ncbi:hypothetical protein RQM59_08615 [Flavobacteriaceae bacterium S356]|uniref:Uncharacterized protein n=1 Tax=Asprobacillus argus TaxID=3076534 RepID=A0ABU3LFK9_9FLAO|nr:hypothetical protein [Flavobacteriaceae bacterium S356]
MYRKRILTILLIAISTTVFSQLKSKVYKVNGIEVYLLAEPVREYEVIKSKGKGIQWGSFITGGLINESISTKITKYIKRLNKAYKEAKIQYDAVIYTNGKQMNAIRFTDERTDENDRIATVQRINNIPFFVLSEPIKEYTFVKTVGGGIKWKSALTVGLWNNSIEQDLMKFAKKVKKKFKKKKVDAIIYERGKKASAIKFD